LPYDLNDKHHILFTFVNVNTKLKKQGEKAENIIGYSFLSINKQQFGVINDEIHELFLYKDLEPFYLQKTDKLTAIKADGKVSPLFQVKTRLVSSVWTLDPILSQFFECRNNIETIEKKILGLLTNADRRALYNFSL